MHDTLGLLNTRLDGRPLARWRLGARSALRRRLPWALWVLTLGQVGCGVLLGVLNRLDAARFFAEYLVSTAVSAVCFATVGALIVARRPENAIGWLLCAAGVGFGWATWLNQYARYILLTAPGSLPGGDLILWLNLWSGTPVVLLTAVVLPLLYPDGRLPSRRWWPAAWLALASAVLLTLSFALSPGPIDASQPNVPNPYAPANAAAILATLQPVAGGVTLAAVASGAAALLVRFRRAQGVLRAQVKWFAYAVAILLCALVTPIVLYFPRFTEETLLSGVLVSIGFPALPLATGLAILRYRLYEIDRLINRTLVYAALTACVVVLYVFVVGYLSSLFRTEDNLVVSLVATGAVAVLFQPLRDRLQRGVNHLLYGERDDPYAVLRSLGRRLEAALAADQVLSTVVTTVREALNLPYVAITLEDDGTDRVSAASGAAVGNPLRLPLMHHGETVGYLLVGARDPEEPWSTADRELLVSLAQQAGAAVHGVRLTAGLQRLTADLQQARERLVLAREDERRRLRHDLHDELAPTLASLSLTAATARDLLGTDPAAAQRLVAELQAALRACVGDVRRLAYNLRPPVLDELGLLAAIRERARQYDGWTSEDTADAVLPLRVRVLASEDLPSLPAAVEVAAYRIVSEALMNVVRHAQASRCTIRLTLTEMAGDRRLLAEVEDDGAGLAADYQVGVGLRSMRERAAELGGDCVVVAGAAGGTVVRAWLPAPLITPVSEASVDST